VKLTVATLLILGFSCSFPSSASCQTKDSVIAQKLPVEQFLIKGSRSYLDGDYVMAIAWYQKAFDLDTADSKLPRAYWYVLVDNLGMSYGITGKLTEAEQIFRYGLTKDSTYPMFYYNLGCNFAEQENLDSAMANLTRAYEYKNNMLKGEHLPDPSTDGSFQRFMKNEKFLNLIDRLKGKK
jgi:tetratricopeptide (TPR) repeat protein